MDRVGECTVCRQRPADGGAMQCGHAFCHDCFRRYVDGSVRELRTHLRCCVCGWQNVLVTETLRHETPIMDFGRTREPRLTDPVGICRRSNGDFVVTDAGQKRVFVYDRRGVPITDFAHLHQFTATLGAAVSKDDRLVIPLRSPTSTNLALYTTEGTFLRSSHLDRDADIGGVAVTSTNHLVVTDRNNARIHVINDRGRHERTINVPQLQGERFQPRPHGVAVNSDDDVIVTDAANHCVKVFDGEGEFLYTFGSHGERCGQFRGPTGVAVDKSDRIIITDSGNQRVQLFNREGDFRCFVVRYNAGSDVYMAPVDVTVAGCDEVAVLLRGTKDACVGEVRIYEYHSILKMMNYENP